MFVVFFISNLITFRLTILIVNLYFINLIYYALSNSTINSVYFKFCNF